MSRPPRSSWLARALLGRSAARDPEASAARWELRLAAGLVAGWAILATTGLLWVLTRGGGSAVAALIAQPLLLFQPRFAEIWLAGALGAMAILATAFGLNQLVGRALLKTLHPRSLPWPTRLPRPATPTTLSRFPRSAPEAFGFTLIERRPGSFLGWRRHEWILVSGGLLDLLTPEEVEGVVAHELGHLAALDGRYLTFLRTLSRLFRWDPVFAVLSRSLTRREELRADRVASQLTGRPRVLARALYRVSVAPGVPAARPVARALLGARRDGARTDVEERIERLLDLSEECPDRD